MNHLTLNLQPSHTTLWYTPMEQQQQQQQQLKPYPFFYHNHNYNYNYEDADSDNTSSIAVNQERSETDSSTTTIIDKDHMFEKPLTPSDVGKLNRLVIPKQHAEKYFPLAAAVGDASGGGGLLLGFEDEAGKSWKFRYSYWNSSQSYVLTKGWSRYVKDKKLDAGDVVFFERHRFHNDRFFIGWRRRGSNPHPIYLNNHQNININVVQSQCESQSHQISGFPNYSVNNATAGTNNEGRQKVKSRNNNNSNNNNNWRRVRLFGVNLECEVEDDEEPQISDASSLSLSSHNHNHNHNHNHSQAHLHGSGLAMGPLPTSTSYNNYFDYMGYHTPHES